ncbi:MULTISPECIES: hypothetical protein [Pseudomonadaceae]|uniref:hypothetical protein n=1 Tax=Pseudomonadaceae TaxID=135621 RepID=UPI00103D38A9|nr:MULTISPECIES: hypothetical protein [Pseudomonadaceae]MCQ4260976.1 hypothetical protein [Stutzerimonas stutzeri]TCD19186.1 hypothetical protein E0D86_19450 [Pseudomonas sp. IC_126]
MNSQKQIKLPALFAVACAAKILCLIISFVIGDLWITGVLLPITVMVAYLVIGGKYRTSDVSDEKFADSCYYLGFIFTVASIIASLIDLPNIQGDMLTIAARFGAAMITTIVGLTVRVVLVSFRPNMDDALRNNEQSAIDASRRLTDEYSRALMALVHFRGEVLEATTEAVKSVRDSFEEIAKHNAAQMDAHYVELSERNKAHFEDLSNRINYAFIENVREIKKSSMSLGLVVEKYARETGASLGKLNQNVEDFTNNVVAKLDSVAFPDDLFSQKLAGPIDELRGSTEQVTAGVRAVTKDVNSAAKSVERSVSKINTQSESISTVLESAALIAQEQSRMVELASSTHAMTLAQAEHHNQALERLAQQQDRVNERLDAQITSLNVMSKSAKDMSGSVATLVEQISQGQQATVNLSQTVERSHADQQSLINAIKVTMESLPMLVKESRTLSEALVGEMRFFQDESIKNQEQITAALERFEAASSKALTTPRIVDGRVSTSVAAPTAHDAAQHENLLERVDAAIGAIKAVSSPAPLRPTADTSSST